MAKIGLWILMLVLIVQKNSAYANTTGAPQRDGGTLGTEAINDGTGGTGATDGGTGGTFATDGGTGGTFATDGGTGGTFATDGGTGGTGATDGGTGGTGATVGGTGGTFATDGGTGGTFATDGGTGGTFATDGGTGATDGGTGGTFATDGGTGGTFATDGGTGGTGAPPTTTELVLDGEGGVMIVGGKGKKDVAYFNHKSMPPSGDCEFFVDAPNNTQHAVGLGSIDSPAKPMVCGGSRNPDQKSCYVYDIATNSWSQGPSMKRKRVGASATCLDNGVCWIFGGKSKSFTEWYNPITDEFQMGPEMPVNSVHGLCTALAPSGLIYMAARRQPGITRAFTFDPSSQTFTELPSINEEKRYMSCGVLDAGGSEQFVVVGGGVSESAPSSSAWKFDSVIGSWTMAPEYPVPIYGATSFGDSDFEKIFVLGGVTDGGVETDEFNVLQSTDADWINLDPISGPRSFGVPINVPSVCPEPPGL